MNKSHLPSRPFWRQLEPGSYGCGFKSLWRLDYGRSYNLIFDDNTPYTRTKAPRPLLINIWYPTYKEEFREAMPYGDYLRIHSANKRIARFSSELARYARAVMVRDVFQKEEALLKPGEQEVLRELLETDTFARRDAPAAKGRFPCILYMAGADASFEDNTVLCEFLACRGYVVIGSAFQKVDGSSLDVQGTIRAVGDIRFLVAFARSLAYVDWSHIGMVGHSRGAQAAIIYQTEPGCAIDATVSLDTTQDYHSLSEPNWKSMTDPVREATTTMQHPILFAVNANAGFEMADTMTATPRYLFTIDSLFHDDFITRGSLQRWRKLRLAPSAEREAADADANLIGNRYRTLCETILNFFDATLKGHAAALNAQLSQSQAQGFRGDQPHLAYAAPGADGPEPYNEYGSSPPTPRQIRQILRTSGAEAAAAALRKGWKPEPWSVHPARCWRFPAYDGLFAFSVLYQLMAQGKTEAAKTLFQGYIEIGRQAGWPEGYVRGWFLMQGQMSKNRAIYEYLLTLDPGNAEAVPELLMNAD